MHMTIAAIVAADSKEEAKEKAEGIFDGLIGDRTTFDYWDSLAEDDAWQPSEVTSATGKEIIDKLMEYNKGNFLETLGKIRKHMLALSDEQIFEGKHNVFDPEDRINFRHQAYWVGQYAGPQIHLYDSDSEGIRNPEELSDVLSREGGPFWVVPADVHF